ncbi:Ig-like domain-containing protein [Viridibacillus sp. NPDC096237]|uniref:Ig-like domain-containing protein n=1 Tax=Viridibacillus sp. NPDC096237 TaxID=3390721 RepID=UPI003CFFC241
MKKSLITSLIATFLFLNAVFPAFAASSVTITVNTNAEQYTSGDRINISGMVLKDGKAGTGTAPLMQVKKGDTVVETYQWKDSEIDGNGNISKIIFPKRYESGSYTIQITAKNASPAITTFEVTNTNPVSKKSISVQSDKSKYELGEKVKLTGKVILDNKPVDSETVNITIERDGEKVITDNTIKTTKDGTYSFSYDSSKSKVGMYTASVNLEDKSITAKTNSFEIVASKTTPDPVNPVDPKPKPDPVNPVDPKPKPDPNPTTPVVPTPKPDPKIPLDPTPVPDPTVTPHAPEVNVVTSESMEIKGAADAGTLVKVTDKNNFYGQTVTKADGTFSIPLNKKIKAGTILYVTASASDKVSSETTIIVEDKTPPTKPVVKRVTDKDRKVNGTTEAEVKVTIKAGGKFIGTGYSDKNGAFSININTQKAGNILTLTATDDAGNTSDSQKITVVDKTAPKTPSINVVKTTSTKVTGKAEVGSKVYVKAGNKIIGLATVTKKGTFSVAIKKQKANSKLSIYSKDKAGNVGKAKVVTVKK